MIYYGSPDIFSSVSVSLMFQIIFLALSERASPIWRNLTKWSKEKCVNQVVYLEICMEGPPNEPPMSPSVKIAKIMIYHVVKPGFMR